jgi:hypothetical protein
VGTTFTNALPKEQIVSAVNSALVGDGWTRHDESFGPGQGVVARGTKRLATRTPAEASVCSVPAGTTNWFLTATFKPPGFADAGARTGPMVSARPTLSCTAFGTSERRWNSVARVPTASVTNHRGRGHFLSR